MAARRILEYFQTPAELATAPIEDIREVLYRQAKAMRLTEAAGRLQSLASTSAGLTDDIEQIVRTQRWLLRQLNVLDEELERADTAIVQALAAWLDRDRAILASLPGMSALRQAVLLASIGVLGSFRTDRALRKLLGWYPESLESGSSIAKSQVGESGNRLVRRELWLRSMSIIAPRFPDNPFKSYYARLPAGWWATLSSGTWPASSSRCSSTACGTASLMTRSAMQGISAPATHQCVNEGAPRGARCGAPESIVRDRRRLNHSLASKGAITPP